MASEIHPRNSVENQSALGVGGSMGDSKPEPQPRPELEAAPEPAPAPVSALVSESESEPAPGPVIKGRPSLFAPRDNLIYRMQVNALMQAVLFNQLKNLQEFLKDFQKRPKDMETLCRAKLRSEEQSKKALNNVTALELALRTGNKSMCEALRRAFESVNGVLEFESQTVQRVFNGGVDKLNSDQKNKASQFKTQVLGSLCQVMSHPTSSEETIREELDQFRKTFKAQSDEDALYNPYYLLQAMGCYEQFYLQLNNQAKRDLFCVQVIGFIQRHAAAAYQQAFLRDLANLPSEQDISDKRYDYELAIKLQCGKELVTISKVEFNEESKGLGFDYYAPGDGTVSNQSRVPLEFRKFNQFINGRVKHFNDYVRGVLGQVTATKKVTPSP